MRSSSKEVPNNITLRDSGILLTDMDVGNAGVAGSIHLPLALGRRSEKA
jgi:hypothetical protein